MAFRRITGPVSPVLESSLRAAEAPRGAQVAADCVRLRPKMKEHGTKFGRKKEAAVVALLTQAARNRTELVEIGTKTVHFAPPVHPGIFSSGAVQGGQIRRSKWAKLEERTHLKAQSIQLPQITSQAPSP